MLGQKRRKQWETPHFGRNKDYTDHHHLEDDKNRKLSRRGMIAFRGTFITDVKPIIDEAAHTFTGGVKNAARLCKVLGSCLDLKPLRSLYHHEWGINGIDAKPVVALWILTVDDSQKSHHFRIWFDRRRSTTDSGYGCEAVFQYRQYLDPDQNFIQTTYTHKCKRISYIHCQRWWLKPTLTNWDCTTSRIFN